MKKLLLLTLLALTLPSEAQQACFGSSCPSSGGGSSTLTSGSTATSGCLSGGGVLRSVSNVLLCGAGLAFDAGILSIGTASTTRGGLDLYGATHAFSTRFQVSESQGAGITYTLPTTDGGASEFLQTNGSGTLTWAAPSATITSGTTATSGCVAGGVLRSISNLVDCGAGLTYDGTTFAVTGTNSDGRFLGGTAAGNYSQVLIGESTAVGKYGSISRYSDASAAGLLPGALVVFSDTDRLIFSTLYTAGAYRQDLVIGTNGSTTIGGAGITGTTDALTTSNGTSTGCSFKAKDNTTDVFEICDGGDIQVYRTVTAGGTTGAQTIDKPNGSVNFAIAAASVVVTNSLAGTSSLILVTPQAADTTCTAFSVVRAAGSFTITANAACSAETAVAFLVTN